MRSEILQKRRKKYGKAGMKKLTALEEMIVKNQTKRLVELAEVGQNIGRKEIRRKCQKLESTTSTKFPEGWKCQPPEPSSTENTRDGKRLQQNLLEEHWERLISSKNYIEKNEDWMSTTRLENSSLEEQRRKAYGHEINQHRKLDQEGEKIEMQKKRTKEEIMQKTRDCSQKAGISKKEGNKEEMTNLAWSFWKEKSADSEDRDSESCKYNDAKKTKEDFLVKKEGREPSKWKIQ